MKQQQLNRSSYCGWVGTNASCSIRRELIQWITVDVLAWLGFRVLLLLLIPLPRLLSVAKAIHQSMKRCFASLGAAQIDQSFSAEKQAQILHLARSCQQVKHIISQRSFHHAIGTSIDKLREDFQSSFGWVAGAKTADVERRGAPCIGHVGVGLVLKEDIHAFDRGYGLVQWRVSMIIRYIWISCKRKKRRGEWLDISRFIAMAQNKRTSSGKKKAHTIGVSIYASKVKSSEAIDILGIQLHAGIAVQKACNTVGTATQ